jgi:aminoglycoside 6'-N-acetyltransferase
MLIRPYKDSDLEPLFAYRNDPEMAKYQDWDIPYPRERAINWIAGSDVIVPTDPSGRYSAALELKSTGEMIGDAGFMLTEHDARQAHIGYSLARAYWHQGYARPKPFVDYWPTCLTNWASIALSQRRTCSMSRRGAC